MSTFRYVSTDLVTGQVLCDDIPLVVQSFSMQLNGSGTLTGNLPLAQGSPDMLAAAVASGDFSSFSVNAPYLEALECRRAVLWVLEDGTPVWCGVVWDWPHMSLQDGTLPISAQTIDSVFSHRLIMATIEYPQVDIFTAFMDLVTYGTSLSSPYIETVSPILGPPSAAVAAGCRIAGLTVPSGLTAGVPWTASYTYSDQTQIASAWSDMCTSGNLEYAFVPGLDTQGNLAVYLKLGYTQLGRSVDNSGYSLTYPGNVIDYGYQRTGSQSSNVVIGTAPPNGSQLQWESEYPHGYDLADIARGYPVMMTTEQWQGSTVTAQSQVDAFADGECQIVTQGMTVPTVNVGGGPNAKPKCKDIVLGDSCWFVATSPLHPPRPDGSPGLQSQVRISGWTCYPPGPQQSEYIQLTTSATVFNQ